MPRYTGKLWVDLLHLYGTGLERKARDYAYRLIVETYAYDMRTQVRFYVGARRAIAPPKKKTSASPPNISVYSKKERSVAFKIRQNAFPVGDPPRTPLGEL